MSDRLETVVVVTDKGSQTFTKIGDSATKMGASIDKATTQGSTGLGRLSKAGAAAGAAFTSMQGILTLATHANAEAQASHQRLETAISNTGHTLDEYADQLDEASKKALQLGFDDEDAADSIATLTTATNDAQEAINDLSLAEDIARARHISLQGATKLVVAAEQGRYGALARVGIQLDTTASKEEALDALRGKFAGNADAYATTQAAAMDRFRNAAENALEALGAHLGPTQALLMVLPGLSAGWSGAGAALGALAPELTAATAEVGLMSVALGPAGLAAALAAAGAALVIWATRSEEAFVSAGESRKAIDDLTESLNEQAAGGANIGWLQNLNAEWTHTSEVARANQQAFDEVNQSIATIEGQGGRAPAEMGQQWNELNKTVKLTDAQIKTVTESLGTLFSKPGLDPTRVTAELEDYIAALNDGTINGQTFTNVIQSIADNWYDYTYAGEAAAKATQVTVEQVGKGDDAFLQLESSMTAAIETQNAWLRDQYAAAAASKAAAESILKQAQSFGVLDSELERLIAANVSTWAERTANRVINATEGVGSLMSVIIDGTKNLSGQSQNLNDWADDLIGVAGSYGKIDDLLAHGQITLTTYNQAQEAGTRIFADNAAVQEDLLRIQAKQAPLLADAADAQAKYIDQLADLPPQQELVALGWMDQNEALKATNALQLAAAAGAGEYGAAGQAAAEAAIAAQAQADPAFAAMLEDMGLISVGADGTISVNFPDSETIQEAVDGLTDSVDALTRALGGVPPNVNSNVSVTGVENASSLVSGYSYLLDTVNGKQVYTSVYVDALGPGLRLTAPYELGGIVPHAQTGMLTGDSRTVIMNEAGPELVRLPGGSLVYPAGASKEMTRNFRGGGDIHIQHMTVVANNPQQFKDQVRALTFARER